MKFQRCLTSWRSQRALACMAVAAGVLMLSSGSAFAQTYRVIPVSASNAMSNNNGFIVGPAHGYNVSISNPFTGFDRQVTTTGSINRRFTPWAINSGGLSAGSYADYVYDATLGDYRITGTGAMLYRPYGDPIYINYHTPLDPRAINDAGWVVGGIGGGISPAFVWVPNPGTIESGTVYELPCSLGLRGALAINNHGLIGGYCDHSPYLWAWGMGYDIGSWLPETTIIRPDPRSNVSRDELLEGHCMVEAIADSYAFAVNCRGSYGRVAFVSTPNAPMLTQVPGLTVDEEGRSHQVIINDINYDGCAVGRTAAPERNAWIAIKYCSGRTTNLYDEAATTHPLYDAKSISDTGEILATGSGGDIVLTPR